MDWKIKIAFSGFYLVLVLGLLGMAACNGEGRVDRGPEAPLAHDDAQITAHERAEGMYTGEAAGEEMTLVLERPGTARWYTGEPDVDPADREGTWDEDETTVRVHFRTGVEDAEGGSFVFSKEGHRLVGQTYDRQVYGENFVLERVGDRYTLPVEQEDAEEPY